MTQKILNGTIVPLLKKSLDAYSTRQQAIARNISNVDTPGYKPLKVTFEENLQEVLSQKKLVGRKSHDRHIDVGNTPLAKADVSEELGSTGGKVSLEDEMVQLAQNQIRFEFASRVLAGAYEKIRSSILGRAR